MTQYLLEEALDTALELHEACQQLAELGQAEQDAAVAASTTRRDRAMEAA